MIKSHSFLLYQIFSIIIFKNNAGTASSKVVIWDEFIGQHQHQSIQKRAIFNVQLALYCVQIRCRFYAHFSWVKYTSHCTNAYFSNRPTIKEILQYDKQLPRWIMKYSKKISYSFPFYANPITNSFLNLRNSVNYDKVDGISANEILI